MPVRVYHSGQPSAPVVVGTVGTSAIDMLTAVLVDGYGSMQPAGWTRPFISGQVAAFRTAGSNSAFLQVDESVAQAVYFRGYKSMTDHATGTDIFPTVAQLSAIIARKASASNSTPRAWMVIANSVSAYIFLSDSSDVNFFANKTHLTSISSSAGSAPVFFGRVQSLVPGDQYNFICGGGKTSINGSLSNSAFMNSFYFCRNWAGESVVGPRQASPESEGRGIGNVMTPSDSGGSVYATYPLVGVGGLIVGPGGLCSELVAGTRRLPRALIPGHRSLMTDVKSAPRRRYDTFDGVGPLAGKTFLVLDADESVSFGVGALDITSTGDVWGNENE